MKVAVAQELVSCSEGDLNDASKLREFFGSVVLDVGDALVTKCERNVLRERKAQKYLKVGSLLFHNNLPGNEMFNYIHSSCSSMFLLIIDWLRNGVDFPERALALDVVRERRSDS